jgi:hypothetical protein
MKLLQVTMGHASIMVTAHTYADLYDGRRTRQPGAEMRVVVRHGVRPVHAGTVYEPGDVVELSMPVAYGWIGSGWAVEAD